MVVCLHYVEVQTVKVKEPKKKVLECELELSVPVFPTDGSIRYTVLTRVKEPGSKCLMWVQRVFLVAQAVLWACVPTVSIDYSYAASSGGRSLLR